MQAYHLDLTQGKATVNAFQAACQVPCRLCEEEGTPLLFGGDASGWQCSFCQGVCKRLGKSPACEKVHLYGAMQAERFGGRYIYFCPCGLTWFASPILGEGRLSGILVGGPVLMMEEDDFFAHGLFLTAVSKPPVLASLKAALSTVPKVAPSRVNALSQMLLAAALSLSDRSDALRQSQDDQDQQRKISDYIASLKKRPSPEKTGYPVEKERELIAAISRGDQAVAGERLNEILGHLMFSTGDFAALRTRVIELLVVLSRAAISGGADAEHIFGLNYSYLKELDSQTDFESLCRWLTDILRRFVNLVFEVSDIKHRDIIYKAAGYIRENYRSRITLDSTAEFVGYSPSYFSRVFKADMGTSFNSYLNEYRIEKSKTLLLEEGATVLSVSLEVGFDDPSYFSKVFKRVTGMSPGKFRETGGRPPRGDESIA